jgi:hypothetical protein
MRIPLVRRWSAARRQRIFPFLERRLLRERRFKQLIILTTCVVMVVMLRVVPWGRYVSATILSSARQAGRQAIGISKSRSEIDDSWRRFRDLQIEETRPKVEQFYAECDPQHQRLLRYAGMDPEHGLLRWANYNWTILLSSLVFEADHEGRSYRFRPHTRSIWLLDVGLPMFAGTYKFFLVPDGPGLAGAIRGLTARPLETSRQTTNSWGLRGPEPDLNAPLRGIVLGDSYMQGMFLGDDETPPECLRRYLQDHLKTRVSILNTGVLGYSPEQYYYSLIAVADRFHSHFVVVSVVANDFGNFADVELRGVGDWQEGKYWLEKIADYCRAHHWPVLIVPAPYKGSILGRRVPGYLGPLLKILDVDSLAVLDPIDEFVNAHLKLLAEARQQGERLQGCPLFNDVILDEHFSAAGSEVWAVAVGERVILLLPKDPAASR